MAKLMNRGKSTIGDEIKRNGGRENYDPIKADNRAYLRQYRKKRQCLKVPLDKDLTRYVEKHLSQDKWSPETISGRMREESKPFYASGKAIRKYIEKRPGLERFLFENRTHKKGGPKKQKGETLTDRTFIDERPVEALLGLEFGHWEGDFIVSKQSKWVMLVLVERKTLLTLIEVLPNRKNDAVNDTVSQMLEPYEVRSLTLDNDIAFMRHKRLQDMIDAPIFFCHPYSSWEKGLVENTNMWIRKLFVPKKRDIGSVKKKEIENIEKWLNHTPRHVLSYKTAYESYLEEYGYAILLPSLSEQGVRIWG